MTEEESHICALCGTEVEPPVDWVEGMGDELVCVTCLIDHADVIKRAEENLKAQKMKIN